MQFLENEQMNFYVIGLFQAPVWILLNKKCFQKMEKSILYWSRINVQTTWRKYWFGGRRWNCYSEEEKRLTRIDMVKICRLLAKSIVYKYTGMAGFLLLFHFVCVGRGWSYFHNSYFICTMCTHFVVSLNIKSCLTGTFGIEIKKNAKWWRRTEWTLPRALERMGERTNRRTDGWSVCLPKWLLYHHHVLVQRPLHNYAHYFE